MGKNRREVDALCDALEAEANAILASKNIPGEIKLAKRARARIVELAQQEGCSVRKLFDERVRPVTLEFARSRQREEDWKRSFEMSDLEISSVAKRGDETLH